MNVTFAPTSTSLSSGSLAASSSTLTPSSSLVFFGADHGGWSLKQELLSWLGERSDLTAAVADLGAEVLDPADDYPQYAEAVARAVGSAWQEKQLGASPQLVFGILICRSGGGMTMVANRFQGVRAVLGHSLAAVQQGREHLDANVLVLEGDTLTFEQAQSYVETFLRTPFAGERHARRLQAFALLGSSPSSPVQ